MKQPVIIQDAECRVYFGDGCLKGADREVRTPYAERAVILCEKHAAQKILPPLFQACPDLKKCKIYRIDARESAKQIETLLPLWQQWLKDGIDRKTLVINIGGGVLCDMGGFAASVYMRGLPFIHIPTTLLAMADASVGGKTAVDLGEVKNILGQFARPQAVFIDPVFLDTLPKKQMLSGMAEILKMQCIANPRFKAEKADEIFTQREKMWDALRFAIEKKAEITQQDFKEDGPRKTLNFGHTIGHAIEAWALKKGKPITHGMAVAHGMLIELKLSVIHEGFPNKKHLLFDAVIKKYYGTLRLDSDEKKALLPYIKNDKKNRNGKIYPVLLKDWGKCVYDQPVNKPLWTI